MIKRDDILCNLCGLTCVLGDHEHASAHGLIGAKVDGGYDSTPGNGLGALDDTIMHTFSLCEFCLDWLWGCCAIPPATSDWLAENVLREGESMSEALKRTGGCVKLLADPSPPPWKPAEQRVREDDWRTTKDRFAQAKALHDAARDKAMAARRAQGGSDETHPTEPAPPPEDG